jgi:hypothetical protein
VERQPTGRKARVGWGRYLRVGGCPSESLGGRPERARMNRKYQEYLRSQHWHDTKSRKAKAQPRICRACADIDAIDCHHLIYPSRLTKVNWRNDLIWLCRRCHDVAHEMIRSGEIRFRHYNDSPKSRMMRTINAIRRRFGLHSLGEKFRRNLGEKLRSATA